MVKILLDHVSHLSNESYNYAIIRHCFGQIKYQNLFCFFKLLNPAAPAQPPQVVYLPTTSWGDTGWSRPGDQQVGFYKERRTNLVDLRVVVCGKRKLLFKLLELERLLTNLRKNKETGIVFSMEKLTCSIDFSSRSNVCLWWLLANSANIGWIDRLEFRKKLLDFLVGRLRV